MKLKGEKSLSWLKNKTVIGVACIVLALLVCFLITPLYNRRLDSKTDVVVLAEDVRKGEQITNKMVKEIEAGSYHLKDGYVTTVSEAVGKYANTDLYKDEYILKNRIQDIPLSKDTYLDNLNGEKGAISITMQSLAAGLSGKLVEGDIISVITTNDENTSIPDELKYVKVLACTLSDGEDVDVNAKDEKEKEDKESTTAETITLLADKYQAKKLASLEANEKIHVELVYRGDQKNSDKFLKQQDKIIKEMKEDTDEQ
ncbi:Flp pilus assembly protein CpaB [[Clostridium] polysaccharolyticum]|uniref:Pilus assembly protein CpaB n=1 Tax=[Clostridium] polysaccharolyticum TaxID=29364 RepID=A0A1H9Y8I6_9FIRM|nr:RcpC/CpaB family pilus assembly protein [[Clostridium] polysaccharolyticum]SES65221.1 pilus assembly protein CpaB [[Clostridium] polysaccharolyticum]